MATQLDVVNACLGSLGERPLSALTEPHAFKGAAITKLSEANDNLQQRGWWFNNETLTLSPSPSTGHLVLPGDCIKWQSGVRASKTLIRHAAKPWVVQRGLRLYDTLNGTYVFTEDIVGEITRRVTFEELPPVFASYVAAEAVLRFQSVYDADNSKRLELAEALRARRVEAVAEDIRQRAVNLLSSNEGLARIKARRGIYR